MGTKGSIPAKVIKVRNLIRAPGQQGTNFVKVATQKLQDETKSSSNQAQIIAMKNNFMIHNANEQQHYNGSDEKKS